MDARWWECPKLHVKESQYISKRGKWNRKKEKYKSREFLDPDFSDSETPKFSNPAFIKGALERAAVSGWAQAPQCVCTSFFQNLPLAR